MVAVKLPVVVRRGRQGVLQQDLYLWRRIGPPIGLHAFIYHLVSQKKKSKEKRFLLMQQADAGRMESPLFRSGADQ